MYKISFYRWCRHIWFPLKCRKTTCRGARPSQMYICIQTVPGNHTCTYQLVSICLHYLSHLLCNCSVQYELGMFLNDNNQVNWTKIVKEIIMMLKIYITFVLPASPIFGRKFVICLFSNMDWERCRLRFSGVIRLRGNDQNKGLFLDLGNCGHKLVIL